MLADRRQKLECSKYAKNERADHVQRSRNWRFHNPQVFRKDLWSTSDLNNPQQSPKYRNKTKNKQRTKERPLAPFQCPINHCSEPLWLLASTARRSAQMLPRVPIKAMPQSRSSKHARTLQCAIHGFCKPPLNQRGHCPLWFRKQSYGAIESRFRRVRIGARRCQSE